MALWMIHLHSTMLLLYRFPGFFISQILKNLHSTMLLLYHNLYGSTALDEIIYIPLCFYFIDIADAMFECGMTIYIPLCFYFISCCLEAVQGCDLIYIPLCFYFIRWRVVRSVCRGMIYIPLCFYFIADERCRKRSIPQFTFHYASTLSRPPFPLLLSSIR